MQKINKITIVLFAIIALLFSGCAVFRKSPATSGKGDESAGFFLYSDIVENNIAGKGVFVRRGRVEALIEGNRDRFTINVRVSEDGRWLVSVRSFASIEIARIYADKEGVTILDRIGRTATIRKWNDLNREFGLKYEMLPMILGDVPDSRTMLRRRIECSSFLPVDIGWASVNMTADCYTLKASSMVIKDSNYSNEVKIDASGFIISDNGLYFPTIIEVSELTGVFNLKIILEDVETRWSGNVDFEIPSGYKIER